MKSATPYWKPSELIVIGIFTALIKVSSLLTALAGGGMNPVTLVLKNTVATSLLILLVHKVPKFGVLSLYALINSLFSLLMMSGNPMGVLGTLLGGVTCDVVLRLVGGYKNPWWILGGVAGFDFFSRLVSLGYSFLLYREQTSLFIVGTIVVTLGYLGCLIGLGTGSVFVKELKHAGIIRN